MENQRTRLTKIMFKQGLLNCLKDEDFVSVSVRSICKQSQLNRSTFYLHYTDKYQLLNEIEDEFIKESEKSFAFDEDKLLNYLQYIKTNKELYKMLLQNSLDFKRKIINNSLNVIKTVVPFESDQRSAEYIYHFLIEGGMAIITDWIDKDCDKKEKDLAGLIYRLTNSALKDLPI